MKANLLRVDLNLEQRLVLLDGRRELAFAPIERCQILRRRGIVRGELPAPGDERTSARFASGMCAS